MRHIMHKKSDRAFPVVDNLALLIGVVQPLMTVPQIITVINAGDASQISFLTWMAFNVSSVILLWYGLLHRLMPIIVSQILWLVVQTAMIVLIFVL